MALFTAGAGTLIFQLVTRRMVPVFLASSFAFIGLRGPDIINRFLPPLVTELAIMTGAAGTAIVLGFVGNLGALLQTIPTGE